MYQYFTLLWFGQEFGRYSHWVSVDCKYTLVRDVVTAHDG